MSETIGIYSIGFLDAAVALFQRARDGGGLVDCAFYPAAYTLRHGTELFVKQLSIHHAYEMRDVGLLYEPGHDLETAWRPLARYAESLPEDAHGEEDDVRRHVVVINTVVEGLHMLDGRGTLLRYPEDVQSAKPARANKPALPRVRKDKHVPFDDLDLDAWHAKAEATFEAAQSLLYVAAFRTDYLRFHRGEPPKPLSELVAAYANK